MTTVGSFEAKAHWPQLLKRVARGEKVLITRHGKPAAMLVPVPLEEKKDLKQIIKEFKDYSKRQRRSLGGISARELIEEGRRL